MNAKHLSAYDSSATHPGKNRIHMRPPFCGGVAADGPEYAKKTREKETAIQNSRKP